MKRTKLRHRSKSKYYEETFNMKLKKTTAWKWFALYIKERDNWTCQTCGKKGKGQFMNAGHNLV